MNLNPADVLNPILNALDALIKNYGVYLYLVFVWLSLLVIAWVFERWTSTETGKALGQGESFATALDLLVFRQSLGLAVKRVTDNQGKHTPGVDGKIWSTPASKHKAIGTLRRHR